MYFPLKIGNAHIAISVIYNLFFLMDCCRAIVVPKLQQRKPLNLFGMEKIISLVLQTAI